MKLIIIIAVIVRFRGMFLKKENLFPVKIKITKRATIKKKVFYLVKQRAKYIKTIKFDTTKCVL